ncbi:hypothetical protein [Nonomuraea sp. NPDC049400]|uniref:hypothetical protein n=1 Tax=Nonomuraea sp. NPDC049400 TaxID=3364352 RepID=UPI003789FFB0
MPGTGKATALEVLAARGHRTVDADSGEWSHWVTAPDGSPDRVWREDAMAELLRQLEALTKRDAPVRPGMDRGIATSAS